VETVENMNPRHEGVAHPRETHFRRTPPLQRRQFNGAYELSNIPQHNGGSSSSGPFAAYHNSALHSDETNTLRLHNYGARTEEDLEVAPLRRANNPLASSAADLERNAHHGYGFSQDEPSNFVHATLIYHPTSHRV